MGMLERMTMADLRSGIMMGCAMHDVKLDIDDIRRRVNMYGGKVGGSEIRAMADEIESLRGENACMKQALERAKAESKELLARVRRESVELEAAQEALKERNKSLENTEAENEALRKRIEEQAQIIKNPDGEIARLEHIIDMQHARVSCLIESIMAQTVCPDVRDRPFLCDGDDGECESYDRCFRCWQAASWNETARKRKEEEDRKAGAKESK